MVGEIGEADEAEFLSGAHALLFPIDWPEPFGLVMIEATACRTPVIAFEGGSVREVVEEGATGFVRDVAGAVAAVARLSELLRAAVRRHFEGRFTARRMARNYLGLYRRLAGRARSSKRPRLINAMARASSLGLLDPLWTPKCREWCRRPD